MKPGNLFELYSYIIDEEAIWTSVILGFVIPSSNKALIILFKVSIYADQNKGPIYLTRYGSQNKFCISPMLVGSPSEKTFMTLTQQPRSLFILPHLNASNPGALREHSHKIISCEPKKWPIFLTIFLTFLSRGSARGSATILQQAGLLLKCIALITIQIPIPLSRNTSPKGKFQIQQKPT